MLDELPLRAGGVVGAHSQMPSARSISVAIERDPARRFALTNRHRPPASSGTAIRMVRIGQTAHGVHQNPARRADQAEQHHQRIAVEIARLEPRGDAVAEADRTGRAVRAEAVDRPLVAALPEQMAEPHRRADEDAVVELVEIPFVDQEAVQPGNMATNAAGASGLADVVAVGDREADQHHRERRVASPTAAPRASAWARCS